MTSNIDPTKPAQGVPALKSDMRANWQAAHDEIEVLQASDYLYPSTDGQENNDAIAARLVSYGNAVRLAAGDWPLANPIIIPAYSELRGSGRGTILKPLHSGNCIENAAPLSTSFTRRISIRDLTLDGDYIANHGIEFKDRDGQFGVVETLVSSVYVTKFNGDGVHLDKSIVVDLVDVVSSFNLHALRAVTLCNSVRVHRGRYSSNRYEGILFGSRCYTPSIDSAAVESNGQESPSPGIHIGGHTYGGKIVSCHLEANRSGEFGQLLLGDDDMEVLHSRGFYVFGNLISGKKQHDPDPSDPLYGIRIKRAIAVSLAANMVYNHDTTGSSVYIGTDASEIYDLGNNWHDTLNIAGQTSSVISLPDIAALLA